MCNNGKA